MVKILLGTACVLLIAACLLAIQIGFRKDPASTTHYTLPAADNKTLGGIIIGEGFSISKTGLLSVKGSAGQLSKVLLTKSWKNSDRTYTNEIWMVNYDGSAPARIPITLPSGLYIGSSTGATGNTKAFLSPDGKTVFFNVSDSKGLAQGIYASNVDGSAIRQLITTSGADSTLNVSAVY